MIRDTAAQDHLVTNSSRRLPRWALLVAIGALLLIGIGWWPRSGCRARAP